MQANHSGQTGLLRVSVGPEHRRTAVIYCDIHTAWIESSNKGRPHVKCRERRAQPCSVWMWRMWSGVWKGDIKDWLYLLQREFVFPNRGQSELVWSNQDEAACANSIRASWTGYNYRKEHWRNYNHHYSDNLPSGRPHPLTKTTKPQPTYLVYVHFSGRQKRKRVEYTHWSFSSSRNEIWYLQWC